MKKSLSFKIGLSMVFSFGVLVGLTPAFALYKEDASSIGFNILRQEVATYKLEITNNDKTSSKNIYSYNYDASSGKEASFITTSLGSSFELINEDGVYVPNGWTSKDIYVKKNTRFVFKKYIDDVATEIGTDIIGDEGFYTITPTYDGENISLSPVQLKKAIYVNTSSFSSWEDADCWFSMYIFNDALEDRFWLAGEESIDHYHRYFIDNSKLGYNVIATRNNPSSSSLDWGSVWTQTPSTGGYPIGNNEGKNCLKITNWNEGSWENYDNE